MTEEYSINTVSNVDSVPVTNNAVERTGVDLMATQFKDRLDYTWEVEDSGIRYDITLYDDGNIEVEGRDSARLFANSPWREFSFEGHISDIERGEGAPVLEEEERNTKWGDPREDEIPLHRICDSIENYSDPNEEAEEHLEDLVAKVQRAAVSWESDSGEDPSKYR